jgi:uncharacterized protein YcbX
MTVTEIWRYPVKSMAGERVMAAQLTSAGLTGETFCRQSSVLTVMTTSDPDTAGQDPEVLRQIVRRFSGQLCLNATVTRAGRVEAGQRAEVVAP